MISVANQYQLAMDKAHRNIFWASDEGSRVSNAALRAAANVNNALPDLEVSKVRASTFALAVILYSLGWPK